jgi:hypothetical protein
MVDRTMEKGSHGIWHGIRIGIVRKAGRKGVARGLRRSEGRHKPMSRGDRLQIPPSSGFPNYHRPQLPASNSNSSQRLNRSGRLTAH